jgi:hypothetical protein
MSEEDSLLRSSPVVAPMSSWLMVMSTQMDSGSDASRHFSIKKGSDPSENGGVSTDEP